MSMIGKTLSAALDQISNHSDLLLQKWVAAGSLISLPTGLMLGVSNNTIQKIASSAEESASKIPVEAWGLPDYAAIVSITLGLCGILQIFVNVYYKIKNGGK